MKHLFIFLIFIGIGFIGSSNPISKNLNQDLKNHTSFFNIKIKNSSMERTLASPNIQKTLASPNKLALLQYSDTCPSGYTGEITYWIVYDDESGDIVSSGVYNECYPVTEV